MGLYSQFPNGDVLSLFPQRVDAMFDAVRGLERGTVPPTITPTGLLWFRTNEPTLGDAIKWWNGAAFQLLLDPEYPQVNAGGTVAFTANQPMGNHKLSGLAAGTVAGDSVRFEQVMLLSGVNAMLADLDLGGFTLVNLGDDLDMDGNRLVGLPTPTDPDEAATLADVQGAAPTAGTFTTSAAGTSTGACTLGFQPTHLLISLDTASGPLHCLTVNSPGNATPVTVGAVGDLGAVAFTITRTGTGFSVSFANPVGGTAWNGRVLAWRA